MSNNLATQISSPDGNSKKPGRSKTILWIGVIVLLIIGGGYAYYRLAYLPSQTATDQPQIQTATARQGDLTIYASGTGSLIAQSEATFGFKTSGQVAKVDVNIGDTVEAGQVLAELNSDAATLAYQQAKRAFDELTSPVAIATVENSIATSQDDVVTTRAYLQYLISPAVQIWQERLADAQAALTQAQADAAANPSAEADQKVQDAQNAVKLAEANLAEGIKDYPTYAKATFSETRTTKRGDVVPVYATDPVTGKRYVIVYNPQNTDIQSAQAAYDLAKATLKEQETYLAVLNGGDIPKNATGSSLATYIAAKEALQSAQDDLQNTQLVAPIGGTVMSLDVNVGDYVSSGTTIAQISDLNHPSLEVFLDESDWNNAKVGNDANVTFDILSSRTFTGKVTQVDPGLYTSNGTSSVRIIVTLDNVGSSFNLPLGTSASVDVIGGQATNAILVPLEALNQNGSQYTVYLMKNGVPTEQPVKVGLQDTLYAEILSGLQPGDVVAINYTVTK